MRRPTCSSVLQASGLLIAAATVLAPVAADAAFPGTNGRVVFDSTRNGAVNVYSVDPANTADVRLHTTSTNIDEIPFGSPDGTKIVFRSDRADPGNGLGNIYLVSGLTNLDPNTFPPDGAVALTSGGADDTDPSFIDDATVVYSHKQPGGNYGLFTVAVATQVSTPLLIPVSGCDDRQAVANPADTDVFAFTRICGGVSHVLVYDRSSPTSGTNPLDLTVANTSAYAITQDAEPDWAPDGSRLAVAASGPTQFGGFTQLYSVLPDGSGRTAFWPTLVNGTGKNDRFPAYSPDGTKLTFTPQRVDDRHRRLDDRARIADEHEHGDRSRRHHAGARPRPAPDLAARRSTDTRGLRDPGGPGAHRVGRAAAARWRTSSSPTRHRVTSRDGEKSLAVRRPRSSASSRSLKLLDAHDAQTFGRL